MRWFSNAMISVVCGAAPAVIAGWGAVYFATDVEGSLDRSNEAFFFCFAFLPVSLLASLMAFVIVSDIRRK